ncbi:kinase-like domain-containing protein [Aspergillus californicus]
MAQQTYTEQSLPLSRRSSVASTSSTSSAVSGSSVCSDESIPPGFTAVLEAMDELQLPSLGSALFKRLYPEDRSTDTIPTVGKPLHGSFNILFSLTFTNGLRWLVKIPSNGSIDRWDEPSAAALTSEANTMRLIRCKTTIPLPDVLDFSASIVNPLRCPYIVLSFIPGELLSSVWFRADDESAEVTRARRTRALEDIASAMAQLNRFSFKTGGTLYFDAEGNYGRSKTGPMRRWDQNATMDNKLPKQGEIYSQYIACSDSKYYSTLMLDRHYDPDGNRWANGVEMILRKLIEWFPEPRGVNPFVLSHPDFNWQNIIVSEDGTLQGIIDWDGVAAVPRFRGNEKYPLWLLDDYIPRDFWEEPWVENKEEVEEGNRDSFQALAEYRRIYNDIITSHSKKVRGKPAVSGSLPIPGTKRDTRKSVNLCSLSLIAEALDSAACDGLCRTNMVENIVRKILDAVGDKGILPERAGLLIGMFADGEVDDKVLKEMHRGFLIVLSEV